MYEIYQRLLDEKGLKNSDVSRGANVSNMTLSDWKHGKTTPKTDTMKKIADFLGVSVDYLMHGNENKYSEDLADELVEIMYADEEIKKCFTKILSMPKEKQEHIISIINTFK